MDLDKEELEATRRKNKKKGCEYCYKKVNNKTIKDIDEDKEDKMNLVFIPEPMLNVELDGEDRDGYKPSDFFKIEYCPMCRKKVRCRYMKDFIQILIILLVISSVVTTILLYFLYRYMLLIGG